MLILIPGWNFYFFLSIFWICNTTVSWHPLFLLRSQPILFGVPLYMTSQFYLLLSRFFFFVLDFQHFDAEMSAVEILLFILQKFLKLFGCTGWCFDLIYDIFDHYFSQYIFLVLSLLLHVLSLWIYCNGIYGILHSSASLTMLKPLTVRHNKLWKILKEIGIPYYLTCLLRKHYAG